MKILHTADWHIGRMLYGRKRYEEFESFLSWLVETIKQHEIDVLLVAGDVFDTTAPSNRSQELYYRFLCRVAASSCRHIVVIAGNHDSPSFLNAPKELLKTLNVHVVGSATPDPEDEVLTLYNEQGAVELIVAAVPYLRDSDIRVAEAGESVDDKERKLLAGIRRHYESVGAVAERKRSELGPDVPIVGMGHLFTAGAQTIEGDGVRELYVGALAHVSTAVFPACFDYVALGHLHVPQVVGGLETVRYSGSPLPMGFGEARQQKQVCLVTFRSRMPTVELINVPVFQKLERVIGDWDVISKRLGELKNENSRCWFEVVYDGAEVIGDLRDRLEEMIAGTQMEIRGTKNTRIMQRALGQTHEEETLDDLNVNDVFERCLDVHDLPEEQRAELIRTYREAVASLDEDDLHAE